MTQYNGLNLACILLEEMILDNKENNESWMRTVCTQFIDLVVQLIIEPQYQKDVRWTLHHLIKMDSEWPIADIYHLIKNGLLMFHDHQNNFYRYLTIIRNFALHPSLNIRSGIKLTHASLRSVLNCNDENTWKCIEDEVKEQEMEKSLDQVLRRIKGRRCATKGKGGTDKNHQFISNNVEEATIVNTLLDFHKNLNSLKI